MYESLSIVMCVQVVLRGVIGFNFRLELGGAALVHLSYILKYLHWNWSAPQRAFDFYAMQGLDLSKHMRWSLLLTNVGLTARCYYRVILHLLSVWAVGDVATIPLQPASYYAVFIVLAVIVLPLFRNMPTNPGLVQYDKLHRWLHSNPTLYVLIHKIHHVARYPILSDSGTESPLEFWLDEVNILCCAMPLPSWLLCQYLMQLGHLKAHDFTASAEGGLGHRLHHSINTGNYSYPIFDVPAGTEIDRSKIPQRAFGLTTGGCNKVADTADGCNKVADSAGGCNKLDTKGGCNKVA